MARNIYKESNGSWRASININKTRYRKSFHTEKEAIEYVNSIKKNHTKINHAHRLYKSTEELKQKVEELNPNIILLGKYSEIKNATKVRCKCLRHNHEYEAVVSQLTHGAGLGCCKLCIKEKMRASLSLSHEEYVKRVAEHEPNIRILGHYSNMATRIECICTVDGYTWKPRAQELLIRGCPVCKNSIKTVATGINDVISTNPEILPYLVNPDDVKQYKAGSEHIAEFKCPECGYVKPYAIKDIVNNGFSCGICSDGVSYPNKISRYMLLQLPVDNLTFEYSTEWSKPYRYDNYFEYDGRKYILEMDGIFHYKQSAFKTGALPLNEIKKRDLIKEQRAREHGITVIRIDCIKSEKKYIINNIEKSLLADIFDLSIIDWDNVEKSARSTLIKRSCELFMNQDDLTPEDIGKHLKISKTTARKYLKIGANIGWCNYDEKESQKRGKIKVAKAFTAKVGRSVAVYDSNHKLITTYVSISETSRQLSKIIGNTVKLTTISNRCVDHKSYKGFYFEYLDSDENSQKAFDFSKTKKVSVFDIDHTYIQTFNSATSAAKGLSKKTGESFRPQSVLGKCGSGLPYKGFYFEYSTSNGLSNAETHNIDNTKPVLMISMEGELIRKYNSIREASADNRIPKESISFCAARNSKSYPDMISYSSYGYVWIYADVVPENITHFEYRHRKKRKVQQINDNGIVLNTYNSVRDAERETNIHNIHNVLSKKDKSYNHKAGGYYWKYV